MDNCGLVWGAGVLKTIIVNRVSNAKKCDNRIEIYIYIYIEIKRAHWRYDNTSSYNAFSEKSPKIHRLSYESGQCVAIQKIG